MGPVSNPPADMGPDLRVHEMRVADAPFMPIVVSANTDAASIMIADRAGELVLD